MRPTFGSRVPMNLWEVIQDVPQLVEDAVASAFSQFLPTLVLQAVTLRQSDDAQGTVELEIAYAVPGYQATTTTLTFEGEY